MVLITMPSNLLCIPLRVTPVGDLGKQLELGIKQEFFQALDQFERDCQYMQELRSQVALLNDSNLVRSDDLKVLEYYVQLEGLSRKFPDYVMETQWQGSLGYHLLEPMLSLSVAIEKVNVIYQLGAVYSQLTELESHFTGEGLKKFALCSSRLQGVWRFC